MTDLTDSSQVSQQFQSGERTICVVGLGYVGLPVLVALAKKFKAIGFDISQERVTNLQDGLDITREVSKADLQSPQLSFTNQLSDMAKANFYIMTVPTPVDEALKPDLSFLQKASEMVGQVLKKGDIVVYESTVYPGATEEDCLPILEKVSGLRCGIDFGLGYSPERINPGDKKHTFTTIKKVVSADSEQTLKIVADVYGSVVEAGLHLAPSIKVAEAAKIIENTQRDLNVSLMNELAIIFDKMGIDTLNVIEAASTKWNFLKFTPGLVGGHCIGIDPYYLTYKAEKLGHYPQVILSGRRINNHMGKFIAEKTIKLMIKQGHNITKTRATILGITFKENCPDTRNTKVVDVVKELQDYGVEVQISDEWANAHEVQEEYGIKLTPLSELKPAECLIVAVQHERYKNFLREDWQSLISLPAVIIDVKGTLEGDFLKNEDSLIYWRL